MCKGMDWHGLGPVGACVCVQETKDQTGPALSVNDPKWKCGDGGQSFG